MKLSEPNEDGEVDCEPEWTPTFNTESPGPNGPGLAGNEHCLEVFTFGEPELFNHLPFDARHASQKFSI